MIQENCKVASHVAISGGYSYLSLEAPGMAASAAPGQFVHVRVPGLEETAIRRPFSIFDARDGILTLLYKNVGRGTAALSKIAPGDAVDVLGPLGHGFPLKCSGTALLVGGGFGVAPLYFLARRLKEAGHADIVLFAGGRTAQDLLALDRFEALGVEARVATNDGSAGAQGLVTVPLDGCTAQLSKDGKAFEFFACGPDPMLKAVASRAVESGAKGWISMDRHMVCGVGACYACIQKTVRGNSRCCIEGPVFSAADLVW